MIHPEIVDIVCSPCYLYFYLYYILILFLVFLLIFWFICIASQTCMFRLIGAFGLLLSVRVCPLIDL